MTRFIMLGGFLGAGKTTAIARLARRYTDQGLHVGIVTNDQAHDLVDTRLLRSQGFDVGEVPGACFCCKFDDLVRTVSELSPQRRPDVILAEPVGSCTDLVATVIEPLHAYHGGDYEIAPFVALLKPEHGRKILSPGPGGGFSPQAAYIFLKQLEEADVVAINKIDALAPSHREELRQALLARVGNKVVLWTSGRTGEGFDDLELALQSARPATGSPLPIDYDLYARGEAELGWLNATARITAIDDAFDLDQYVRGIVEALARRFRAGEVEVGHVKVLGQSPHATSVANLVGSDAAVEWSLASGRSVSKATLIVNARAACEPERLRELVEQSVASVGRERKATAAWRRIDCFRPARPQPTHRIQT